MGEEINKKEHWQHLYLTADISSKSWYETTPAYSLSFFAEYNIPLSAEIIDVGGGNSFLVDHLLKLGYRNITVMDISRAALENARKRLGEKGNQIRWVEADAADFKPERRYDVWHDRAAFHFLTENADQRSYDHTSARYIRSGGLMMVGTFSVDGPDTCSHLTVQQYSEESMSGFFSEDFEKLRCEYTDHITPSGTVQNFVFCRFRRK